MIVVTSVDKGGDNWVMSWDELSLWGIDYMAFFLFSEICLLCDNSLSSMIQYEFFRRWIILQKSNNATNK